MGNYLFGTSQDNLEKGAAEMDTVVVPAILEQNLALGDGSCGCPVQKAILLDMDDIPNLYRVTGDQFELAFQERGVAYNETEASEQKAEVSFKIQKPGSSTFSLNMDPTPVVMWGINFAGRVVVKHKGGQERVIYLPGTRTYDPAGITGQFNTTSTDQEFCPEY